MSLPTATLVRVLPALRTGHNQRVYRLSAPLEGSEYVLVSAVPTTPVSKMMGRSDGGPETVIVACDAEGSSAMDRQSVVSALCDTLQGSTDHAAALAKAGYRLEEAPDA